MDYFVVSLSRLPNFPARLAGVVERLGSGERRWFDGGERLLWLMTAWPEGLTVEEYQELTDPTVAGSASATSLGGHGTRD